MVEGAWDGVVADNNEGRWQKIFVLKKWNIATLIAYRAEIAGQCSQGRFLYMVSLHTSDPINTENDFQHWRGFLYIVEKYSYIMKYEVLFHLLFVHKMFWLQAYDRVRILSLSPSCLGGTDKGNV